MKVMEKGIWVDGEKEGRRKGGKEGGREGGREGRREGGKETRREGGREDVLSIVGDWNAKVGSQEIPGVTGKFDLEVKMNQGKG